MPVKVAYFIKIVRDALPTKPTFEYFEKDNDELATKKLRDMYHLYLNLKIS